MYLSVRLDERGRNGAALHTPSRKYQPFILPMCSPYRQMATMFSNVRQSVTLQEQSLFMEKSVFITCPVFPLNHSH